MSGRRWRASEVGLMLDRYASQGATAVSHELARSVDAVTSEARRLGLPSAGRRRRKGVTRADNNGSVTVRFFEGSDPAVAFVLGFVWAAGTVKRGPQHVLRLRCPAAREAALLTVRALMGSSHRVQSRRGRVLCEVSSRRLVEALLRNFGSPPRGHPGPRSLPPLPGHLYPHFCRGLLAATGERGPHRVTWAVSSSVAKDLSRTISRGAGVGDPDIHQGGASCTISWSRPEDLRRLDDWLRAGSVPPRPVQPAAPAG